MSEPFIGEIRMFAGNFAPRDWAFCDGQILATSQNDALFSLIGTIHGGDGRTSFALPDMRGRLPVHQGQGPELTKRYMGKKFGTEYEVLNASHIPNHHHTFNATTDIADSSCPTNNVLAAQDDGDKLYAPKAEDPARFESLHDNTVSYTGGNKSHSNMMPSLCINFIIAMRGIYPNRS